MKRLFASGLIVMLALVSTSSTAQTPLGSGFLYQGKLKQNGVPFAGSVDIRFQLYAAEIGGTAIGTEVINDVPVADGLFTVEVNAGDEFGGSAFNGESRWLEVQIDGTTLSPRQKLAASPYALHSRSTEGLTVDPEGKVGIGTTSPTSALTVAGTIEAAEGGVKFADGSVQVTAAGDGLGLWTPSGADVINSNSGNVGIGTSEPAAKLDVAGSARVDTFEITGGTSQSQPYVVWGGISDFQTGPFEQLTDVAASERLFAGIRPDQSLVAWGDSSVGGFGQFGVPTGTFTKVAAGGGDPFGIAIRTDGQLVGWGANTYGQINVPSGSFISVSAGEHHCLAIRTNGTLAGWGQNVNGGTSVPTGTFSAISASTGYGWSVGIRSDGTLVAWGDNTYGFLNVPVGTYVAAAATGVGGVAIRSDGILVRWGTIAPVPPSGIFVSVSACGSTFLGLRPDGTLTVWGLPYDDSHGISVPTPSGIFSRIAAGTHCACAIRLAPSGSPALRLLADAAYKPGANTWTVMSDRRLKADISPLDNALEKLLDLHGHTYRWREPAEQGNHYGPQMGLIADEVEQVFPQWIGRSPEGYQTLTVNGFEALTVESFRELRCEKDEEIARRDQEIAELQGRLERIETLLDKAAGEKSGGGE